MTELTVAERIALRGRAVTLAGLAVLSLLAWLTLLSGGGMEPMSGMAMPMSPSFPLVVAMWWVMMIAMMLPNAAPVILIYAQVHRHAQDSPPPTAAFLAGWLGFSLIAAVLQITIASSSIVRTVEGMAFGPKRASLTFVRLRHLWTVVGLIPWRRASALMLASLRCIRQLAPDLIRGTASVVVAPVQNGAHKSSRHSW